MASEIHLMTEQLQSRVSELENKLLLPHEVSPSVDHATTNETSQSTESIDHIGSQVAQLSKTIEMQQKLIEKGEREKRERNVVIVGLNETDTNTEEVVKKFLESKLNIAPPGLSQCRRLG